MKPGKISENVLKRSVLNYIDRNSQEIARGAGIGNDCALFPFCQSAATGVCSFSLQGKNAVRHAVATAVNNLSAGGQIPGYLLLNITLPERAREIKLKEIMEEVSLICEEQGLALVGGHTETSAHVSIPVISATALGCSQESNPEKEKKAYTDYDLVLSGYIGGEAASYIVGEKRDELARRFPEWLLAQAESFRNEVWVFRAAQIARESGVTWMHDVGEGGIFAALWEMARGAGVGLTIGLRQIPMKQSVVEICNLYDLNPYELLSGGCLLMGAEDGEALTEALQKQGIFAAVIGKATDSNDRIIVNGDEVRYMDLPKPDQIRKLL